MDNSIELLEPKDAEMTTSEPSLLLLNDDCLIQIFKRLALLDFVSLAKTCVRLKNVAADSFNPTFEIVSVNDISGDDYSERYRRLTVTRRQFRDVLSVIGWRVRSVEIYEGYDFIFHTVTSRCQNVKSLGLKFSESSPLSLKTCPHLQEFKSLKELTILECEISKVVLRQIFVNNPDIEFLQCDWAYKGFVKLLRLLPKLKTLHLRHIQGLGDNQVPNLFHLKEVNDFEFYSSHNCNKFIIELATRWKLVSLDLTCDTDDETFKSLKLFENLEYLDIANMTKSCHLPEDTVFPSKLKRISFCCIGLTLPKLASIVDELKLLESIHLKKDCLMEFSAYGQIGEMISGIVTALSPVLQDRQRTLKVLYDDNWSEDGGKYFYDSKNLQIINHRCESEETKFNDEFASERTMLRII